MVSTLLQKAAVGRRTQPQTHIKSGTSLFDSRLSFYFYFIVFFSIFTLLRYLEETPSLYHVESQGDAAAHLLAREGEWDHVDFMYTKGLFRKEDEEEDGEIIV